MPASAVVADGSFLDWVSRKVWRRQCLGSGDWSVGHPGREGCKEEIEEGCRGDGHIQKMVY
jgi:hypothetical protein